MRSRITLCGLVVVGSFLASVSAQAATQTNTQCGDSAYQSSCTNGECVTTCLNTDTVYTIGEGASAIQFSAADFKKQTTLEGLIATPVTIFSNRIEWKPSSIKDVTYRVWRERTSPAWGSLPTSTSYTVVQDTTSLPSATVDGSMGQQEIYKVETIASGKTRGVFSQPVSVKTKSFTFPKTTASGTPVSCGTDLPCFQKLLRTCKAGTFDLSGDIDFWGVRTRATSQMTITHRSGKTCGIEMRTTDYSVQFSEKTKTEMRNSGLTDVEILTQEKTMQKEGEKLVKDTVTRCVATGSKFTSYIKKTKKGKGSTKNSTSFSVGGQLNSNVSYSLWNNTIPCEGTTSI